MTGVTNPNGTQTNFANNNVNILELSDHSAETNKYGLDLMRNDTNRDVETDRTENVVRDVLTERDVTSESLTQMQRDVIETCAKRLTEEVCDVVFDNVSCLKEQADKIFDSACSLESRLREQHRAQIEDVKCQFYENINREFVTRARIAGSSRNSFVVQEQNRAVCDMLRKLGSLQAELETNSITAGQNALVAAFDSQATAKNAATNVVMQQALGLWSILKGALTITDDNTDVNDVANSVMNSVVDDSTDQTRTNINWVRQVSNTAEGAGTYTFIPQVLAGVP